VRRHTAPAGVSGAHLHGPMPSHDHGLGTCTSSHSPTAAGADISSRIGLDCNSEVRMVYFRQIFLRDVIRLSPVLPGKFISVIILETSSCRWSSAADPTDPKCALLRPLQPPLHVKPKPCRQDTPRKRPRPWLNPSLADMCSATMPVTKIALVIFNPAKLNVKMHRIQRWHLRGYSGSLRRWLQRRWRQNAFGCCH